MLASSLNIASLYRPAQGEWSIPYRAADLAEPPLMVLDFERGLVAGAQGLSDMDTLVQFSRASVATGSDRHGNIRNFAVDEPVYDWIGGRRGISLRPTQDAQVADKMVIRPASWFSSSQFSFYIDCTLRYLPDVNTRFLEMSDGTGSNRLSLLCNGAGQPSCQVWEGGELQAAIGSSAAYEENAVLDAPFRMACTLREDDVNFSYEGAEPLRDNSVRMPNVTDLTIGGSFSGSSQPSWILHKLVVFDRVLQPSALTAYNP